MIDLVGDAEWSCPATARRVTLWRRSCGWLAIAATWTSCWIPSSGSMLRSTSTPVSARIAAVVDDARLDTQVAVSSISENVTDLLRAR